MCCGLEEIAATEGILTVWGTPAEIGKKSFLEGGVNLYLSEPVLEVVVTKWHGRNREFKVVEFVNNWIKITVDGYQEKWQSRSFLRCFQCWGGFEVAETESGWNVWVSRRILLSMKNWEIFSRDMPKVLNNDIGLYVSGHYGGLLGFSILAVATFHYGELFIVLYVIIDKRIWLVAIHRT